VNSRPADEQKRDAERIRRTLEMERRAEPRGVGAAKRGSCLIFILFVVLLVVAAVYVRANWERFEHLFRRPAPAETSPETPEGGY